MKELTQEQLAEKVGVRREKSCVWKKRNIIRR